jgi:hypothetical protein
MVMAVPTFLNVDGDGTAVPNRSDGRFDLLAQAGPITRLWDGTCRCQCADWKSSADDARGRLMTPSQTKSSSAPEAIENQRSRGGP